VAKSHTIKIKEDGFFYKNQFYFFKQIEKIRFYYEVTDIRHSFQHIGSDHQADLDLYIDVLTKPIKIRTGESWTNFTIDATKGRADSVLDLYSIFAEQTFKLRINKYITEIKSKGFFTYDNKMFHLDGRVVSPKFTLNLITDKPIYKEPFWLLYKTEKNIKSGLFGKKDFYIYTYFDKDVFTYLLKKLYKISHDKNNILFQDSSNNQKDEESFTKKVNKYCKFGEEYKNEIQDYNEAIKINPSDAVAYNNRGVEKSNLGDYKGAIQDFTKAIEINPNFESAYFNRGTAMNSLEDYIRAIENYNKANEINQSKYFKIKIYINRGKAKNSIGDYREAIQDFNKAIEISPNNAHAYFNRGITKRKLEDSKEAIQDFNKAIELNPIYAEAYNNRGFEKNCLEDYREVIENYTKAIKVNPYFETIYFYSGFEKNSLEDYRGAIQDYNKAIEIDPNFEVAYYNRGIAKRNLSDYSSAIEDCSKAIELNPNSAVAYNERGIAKFGIGDGNGSLLDISKAKELKESPTLNTSLFSGGDGSSEQNAVLINATSSLVGVPAEYELIQAKYGAKGTDWDLEQQLLHNSNSRNYDILEIKLSNGSTKKIYFDITNFYGKP